MDWRRIKSDMVITEMLEECFGGDPSLVQRPELMAHKLYEEFEPAALFCLEHWYWNRTNKISDAFDGSYYRNFPSVTYHMLACCSFISRECGASQTVHRGVAV